MKIIIPEGVTIDELERLDPYYNGTHISFNGHYYDHTRKLILRSVEGGDYELIPHKGNDATWSKLGTNNLLQAHHHYLVDTSYKLIGSFITVNGSYICSLPEDDPLTIYISKSCYFFRSLPYNIKLALKENGHPIFEDYTKLKKIS